jgi:hypothetical protein
VDASRVVHHVGVASSGSRLFLQLIVLDRYAYDELSTRLMGQLRTELLDRLFPGELMVHAT